MAVKMGHQSFFSAVKRSLVPGRWPSGSAWIVLKVRLIRGPRSWYSLATWCWDTHKIDVAIIFRGRRHKTPVTFPFFPEQRASFGTPQHTGRSSCFSVQRSCHGSGAHKFDNGTIFLEVCPLISLFISQAGEGSVGGATCQSSCMAPDMISRVPCARGTRRCSM